MTKDGRTLWCYSHECEANVIEKNLWNGNLVLEPHNVAKLVSPLLMIRRHQPSHFLHYAEERETTIHKTSTSKWCVVAVPLCSQPLSRSFKDEKSLLKSFSNLLRSFPLHHVTACHFSTKAQCQQTRKIRWEFIWIKISFRNPATGDGEREDCENIHCMISLIWFNPWIFLWGRRRQTCDWQIESQRNGKSFKVIQFEITYIWAMMQRWWSELAASATSAAQKNMREFCFLCALGIIFIFCRVQIIYVLSTASAHRVEQLFSGSRCRTASARAAKFDFDILCLKHKFFLRCSKSAQQLGERWRVTRMLDLNFKKHIPIPTGST